MASKRRGEKLKIDKSKGEACTGFWWGNLRKIGYLKKPGVDGRIILRWIFRKWVVGVWTGSICLTIGTGDRQL
jgi:hypothetical protein